MADRSRILNFIAERWQDTVRFNREGDGDRLGLPYPYTVPCAKDGFQDLYYWDTYFACRGMAMQGETEQVKNNLLDFIHEIDTFGFIPNGSRVCFLNRSQPPFFGALVELIDSLIPNDVLLRRKMISALEKELDFWHKYRFDRETGLFHYGSNADAATLRGFYSCAVERGGYPATPESEQAMFAGSLEMITEAESGWDFTPRFERRSPECAAVDLNSLIYRSYCVLASLYDKENDAGSAGAWRQRAEEIKKRIGDYCFDAERGGFFDYLISEKRHTRPFSAASLVPLWCGAATPEQAASELSAIEKHLERDFGILTCETSASGQCQMQWAAPNGWPPLHFMAIEGLARYGFADAAHRVAAKYLEVVERNFEKTGDLWEKYNVVDGSINVGAEYKMPAMMGWTAGTYVFAADFNATNQDGTK